MAKLSRDEIGQFAANAGFSGDDIKIAVAVALAESGGNTTAHNIKPPDDSYGLWQINMYRDLGPARRKQFGLKSNDDLFDPATNARVAHGIKTGSGWNAWTTYTSGAYKQHLDEVSTLDVIKQGIADASGYTSIANAINSVGTNLFNGIASIVGIIVALVLLALGVMILARESKPVKQITNAVVGGAVKKVVP